MAEFPPSFHCTTGEGWGCGEQRDRNKHSSTRTPWAPTAPFGARRVDEMIQKKSACGTVLVLMAPPNASSCDTSAFPSIAVGDFAAPGFTKGLTGMRP